MGTFKNSLAEEKGRRKHILVFSTTATFAEDATELVKQMTLGASDKFSLDINGRNSGGTVRADVSYGPVRGANLTDVKRTFEDAKISAVFDGNKTELKCNCSSKGGNCTDETTEY